MARDVDASALPAQPASTAEPQPAANTDSAAIAEPAAKAEPARIAPPDQAAPTAQPDMTPQPAAAVQPAPAANQAPPAPHLSPAQLQLPSELISAPSQAQPAAPDKPGCVIEPTRVQILATSAPQAAVVSQAALPQGTPKTSMPRHNPSAAEGSIGDRSQDKVVSGGCWVAFCCFKAGRRGKQGSIGRRNS